MAIEVDLAGIFETNDTYDYDKNYDSEEEEETEHRTSVAVWMLLLYLVLLLTGLLGNGLLLTILSRKCRSWSITDIFVLHLCFADLLLLLTLPLMAAQAFQRCGWCDEFGLIPCKISRGLFYVSGINSCQTKVVLRFTLSSIPRNCHISGKRRKQKSIQEDAVFCFTDQLLLRDLSAARARSGSLPVLLSWHQILLNQPTLRRSCDLSMRLDLLALPGYSQMDFRGDFGFFQYREKAVFGAEDFGVALRRAAGVAPASPHAGVSAACCHPDHLLLLCGAATAQRLQTVAQAEGLHGGTVVGRGLPPVLDALQYHAHCGHHQKQSWGTWEFPGDGSDSDVSVRLRSHVSKASPPFEPESKLQDAGPGPAAVRAGRACGLTVGARSGRGWTKGAESQGGWAGADDEWPSDAIERVLTNAEEDVMVRHRTDHSDVTPRSCV